MQGMKIFLLLLLYEISMQAVIMKSLSQYLITAYLSVFAVQHFFSAHIQIKYATLIVFFQTQTTSKAPQLTALERKTEKPSVRPSPISHHLSEDLDKSQLTAMRRSNVRPTEADNNRSQGKDSEQ